MKPPPRLTAYAGQVIEAEKQMFYLRRAIGSDPDVLVFNNLRLEHEGEVGQIDHLILHKGGMVIVESKGVTKRCTNQ